MHTLLDNVTRADVTTDPFPHLVLKDALDEELCSELMAQLPPVGKISGGDRSSNERFDLPSCDALADPEITPLWKEFIRAHTGEDFAARLFEVFGDHLPPPFDAHVHHVGDRWPRVGLRSHDDPSSFDVLLDAQLSVNTPVLETSSVKAPHVDRTRALFAGLFYLRSPTDDTPGGDLELYRLCPGADLANFDGQYFPEALLEPARTVTYECNTLVVLLNSPTSFHGVTPREVTDESRRFVNLVCQTPRPFFDLAPLQAVTGEERQGPTEPTVRRRILRRLRSVLE